MKRAVLIISFLIIIIRSNAYSNSGVRSNGWFAGIQAVIENFKIESNHSSKDSYAEESSISKGIEEKEKTLKKDLVVQPSSSRIGIAVGQACFGKYIKN